MSGVCLLSVRVVAEVGTSAPYFITDIAGVMFPVVEMLELDRISGEFC